MQQCRTAALGGHVDACNQCAHAPRRTGQALGTKPKPASASALHSTRWWYRSVWQVAKANPKQQVYVFGKSIEQVFRAKYVQQLREAGIEDKALIESLFKQDWEVYAKRPFSGPQQVIEYLGRYTHKVAIRRYSGDTDPRQSIYWPPNYRLRLHHDKYG